MDKKQPKTFQQSAIELVEYFPSITRKDSETSENRLRFRLLKKTTSLGKFTIHLDIREFEVTKRFAEFTKRGVYLTLDDIDIVIVNLIRAKEDMVNATNHGSRVPDTLGDQSKT